MRLPREVIGQAGWFTLSTAPERAVEEAESIANKHRAPTPDEMIKEMEKATKHAAVTERPRRPNDLEIEDFVPGTRLAVYDDMPGQEEPRLAGYEVIVSEPYKKGEPESAGWKPWVVKSRKVEDHLDDEMPSDPEDGVREVHLEAWGIAPNFYGSYRQNRFVGPYMRREEPAHEDTEHDSAQNLA